MPIPSRIRRLGSLAVFLTVACNGTEPLTACAQTDDVPVIHATEVPPLHPSVDDYDQRLLTLRPPDGGSPHVIAVLLADEPPERRHGLMEVTELPAGTGMVFEYPEPGRRSFWMRNTLVPLDLSAVSPDGEIQQVIAMEPCLEQECPTYPVDEPTALLLETPQGWLDEVGAERGWSVCVGPKTSPTG